MCSAITALNGAQSSGLAEVREAGLTGMITLRGDLGAPWMAQAVQSVTGVAVPEVRKINIGDTGSAAWMSPDEVLLVTDYAEATQHVAALTFAFAGKFATAANVSDARAVFDLSGAGAREALGKLTPADLHPDVFGAGDMRRSRLAQVPAAFWQTEDQSFRIVCFRSVAQYVFDILTKAADANAGVGYYR